MIYNDDVKKMQSIIANRENKTMTTKLIDIKKGSKIFCETNDGSLYIIYEHPDGMYSYCKTEKGGVAHLGLMQTLEEVEGGYKIK